jgi:hypothetical protein
MASTTIVKIQLDLYLMSNKTCAEVERYTTLNANSSNGLDAIIVAYFSLS